MGALVDGIATLRSSAQSLEGLCNPTSTLSAGCSLCERVVSEYNPCRRVTRELPALGEMLVRAKRLHTETMGFIEKSATLGIDGVVTLREKVQEKHSHTVVVHLERFSKFLREVDEQLSLLERYCSAAESRARQMGQTCLRHRGYKSAVGGLLVFSGCFAIMMAVAAVASRRNVSKSISTAAKASGRMSELVRGLPPVNTGLTGGVATVLGARATSSATEHSRLASSFQKLSSRMAEQTSVIQALRTRFQRLVRAAEAVTVLFRVQGVVGGLDDAVWSELQGWIKTYETFMGLLKKSVNIYAA